MRTTQIYHQKNGFFSTPNVARTRWARFFGFPCLENKVLFIINRIFCKRERETGICRIFLLCAEFGFFQILFFKMHFLSMKLSEMFSILSGRAYVFAKNGQFVLFRLLIRLINFFELRGGEFEMRACSFF